jgi:hypothetical protein
MRRIRSVGGGIGSLSCVEERLQVRLIYLILFFAHKNTDYKANTHLSASPQDTVAAYSNNSKAGRSRRMAKHRAKALNGLQAAPKSWFRARVENGLRRGKPWWLPMIGGYRSVAKGVGERLEQPEGLYLGCGPRYSRRKRGLGWSTWSRGGEKIIVMSMDVCMLALASFFLLPLLLSPLRWYWKKWLRLYFPTHWSLLLK